MTNNFSYSLRISYSPYIKVGEGHESIVDSSASFIREVVSKPVKNCSTTIEGITCRESLVYKMRQYMGIAESMEIMTDNIIFRIYIRDSNGIITDKSVKNIQDTLSGRIRRLLESPYIEFHKGEDSKSYVMEFSLKALKLQGGPVFISALLMMLREGCFHNDIYKLSGEALTERFSEIMAVTSYKRLIETNEISLSGQLFYTALYLNDYFNLMGRVSTDANGPATLAMRLSMPRKLRFLRWLATKGIADMREFVGTFKTASEESAYLANQFLSGYKNGEPE